eukprot:3246509-Pyramimonas_sp.AAC.1
MSEVRWVLRRIQRSTASGSVSRLAPAQGGEIRYVAHPLERGMPEALALSPLRFRWAPEASR